MLWPAVIRDVCEILDSGSTYGLHVVDIGTVVDLYLVFCNDDNEVTLKLLSILKEVGWKSRVVDWCVLRLTFVSLFWVELILTNFVGV